MATDKDIQNLVINKLTKEQFEQVENPSPDELWLVEDSGEYITETELQAYHDSTKQNVISDLEAIRDGASKGATAIQNTNDCVHKTGDETVAGVKTFSSTPVISSGILNLNSSSTSIQKQGTNFIRQNATGTTIISSSGTDNRIVLRPNGDTDDTGATSLATDGTLTATKFNGPLTGNVTGNCSGSSGSCTGNSATATKATQDSSGNQINTTYQRLYYSRYALSDYASSNPYIKLATFSISNTTNSDISCLFWVEALQAGVSKNYALVKLSARWGGTAYNGTKFEILEKYGDNTSCFDSLVWAYKYTTASSKGSIIGEVWMKTTANSWWTYYFRPTQCNEFGDYSNTPVKANTTNWTYYDKAGTSTAIASTAITSGYTQVTVTDKSISRFPQRQAYETLSGTNVTIGNYLSDTTTIYSITPSGATTFNFGSMPSQGNTVVTFELRINMTSVQTITFPSSVKWLDGAMPDLSEVGLYYLVFRYDYPSGSYLANLQGKWTI